MNDTPSMIPGIDVLFDITQCYVVSTDTDRESKRRGIHTEFKTVLDSEERGLGMRTKGTLTLSGMF